MRRRTGTRSWLQGVMGIALLWAGIANAASDAQISGDLGFLPKLPAQLPEEAIGKDVLEGDQAQIEARLLVSGGADKRVGVLFDLAPGWHLYWRNPGDTGIAPTLGVAADGFRVGPIAWPVPQIFLDEADGLMTSYGYERRVLLSVALETTADSDANSPAADRVQANPEVLICRSECVPASFSLSSPLDVDLGPDDQTAVDLLFRETRARLPVEASAMGVEASAQWIPAESDAEPLDSRSQEQRVALDVRAPGQRVESFLPLEDQAFEFSGVRVLGNDSSAADARDGATVEIEALRLEDGESRLRGLVKLRDPQGRIRHAEVDLAISPAPARSELSPVPLPVSFSGLRWIQILFLALLGGLILNGMPCVLPVLAIKVVAIADLSDKHPKEVRLQGLAYTGGVLGSMAALAAIVLSLRAAGHSVGWGFQFQEPLFVAGISALLVTFALNLFGVFEIDFGQGRLASVGQSASGFRRSIFEGLLAVVLATPCTAPFLGTAVGFAFAASGFGILAIFLAIGFGLALPFLAVSFAPRMARFIPRSGPWMLKLRAGLGFSLLATVVWLLWVVGQSGGSEAVIGMVAMLLLLAFLLWAFGQAQPLRSAWLARAATVAIAAIAFTGFNLVEFESKRASSDPSTAIDESGWAAYSEQAVATALAQGRPAFVVFTADWCITCKVNEKTVLARRAVLEAFAEGDYALFKADWTRRDETIRSKLAEFGRAGVPLYLVYSPDAPNQPQMLSELLTQDEVTTALARPLPSPRG